MSYPIVGAFVLVLGAVLIGGTLWLASGGAMHKQYDLYLAVENESVAGLNLNAPVKYNGVTVGKVQDIQLDPGNPERVNLLFAIQRGTPIKQDIVAVLKTQGLTGIAYVELSGGSRDAPLLKANDGAQYPLIRTKPSLSTQLESVLTTALKKIDDTSNKIDAMLSEDNLALVKAALADLSVITHTIAARKDDIGAGITAAAATFENSSKLAVQAAPMIDRIGRSAAAVETMGNAIARTSARTGTAVDSIGGDIGRFTAETLPALDQLLRELTDLSTSMKRLTERAERNPAALLLGHPSVPPGPGEEQAETAAP